MKNFHLQVMDIFKRLSANDVPKRPRDFIATKRFEDQTLTV
jgi:hypothetical protein